MEGREKRRCCWDHELDKRKGQEKEEEDKYVDMTIKSEGWEKIFRKHLPFWYILIIFMIISVHYLLSILLLIILFHSIYRTYMHSIQ